MRRIPEYQTLLSASATDVSAGFSVSDYRNCVLAITGSATSANLKVFILGAIGDTVPDFDINKDARTATDNWDFIEAVDLEDGAAIDGDTGISLSGNVVRLIEVNVNSLDWLAVNVTNVISGTVTVKAAFTTNE